MYSDLTLVDENDLTRVRRAVGAYFRAAAAYGSASLAVRHAALLVEEQHPDPEEDDQPDREFLLERAALYDEKARLMSRSAKALLSHSKEWFADLEDSQADVEEALAGFALDIEAAADAHAEVLDALKAASFAGRDSYPELLEEMRGSVRFLSMEAAVFGAVAAGELDEQQPDEPSEEEESPPAEAEAEAVPDPSRFSVRGGDLHPVGKPVAKRAPTFDRRVPESLLDALAPGGPFGWLSALARRPASRRDPPLDLGLRASPKIPGGGHATLYLGTTQVLGVHVRADGLFCLTPHKVGKLFGEIDPPFDHGWTSWQPLDSLARLAPEVERHVAAAVLDAPPGRQLEGRYQAALSKPKALEYVLVDREVMLIFTSQTEKRERLEEFRAPLVEAQRFLAERHRWAARVTPPGDKLDALAIDNRGRLLVIEVKPGTQTNGLGFTPVQVAMYVRLLRAWIQADQEGAREVLMGMARQRRALGLAPGAIPELRRPIEVVPVIAVGKPIISPREARRRFALVREALRDHGEPLEGLALWAVEETGELSITGATDLDARF